MAGSLKRWRSKKATASSIVSRKQKGSGSSASATVMPVRSRKPWRAAAVRSRASAISASRPSASGLKVPGTVERLTKLASGPPALALRPAVSSAISSASASV